MRFRVFFFIRVSFCFVSLGLVYVFSRLITLRWLSMWIRILSFDIRARCLLAVAFFGGDIGVLYGVGFVLFWF